MKFEVKNHSGRVYLTKVLREVLDNTILTGYTSKKTVVLFPKGTELEKAEHGMKAILFEMKREECLRKELEHDKNTRRYKRRNIKDS